MIEIIVVIAILIVIISFGTIIDFSSFTSSTFQNEESKIVSALEQARSHAMANMFQTKFGVCYISPNYIIFRENVAYCVDGEATNELIPANTNIASQIDTDFPAVVFDQLTGNRNTTDDTIHITNGIKLADITINDEGTINW